MANGVSYGFVPELSVSDAVDQARKYRQDRRWVFKTDITAFFDRIDRGLLIHRLERRVKHPTLRPLLHAAVGCEIHVEQPSFRRKLKQMDLREGRGVRQGMPLSPYFANVMLEPFDKACQHAGLHAVRYADDLVFFASSEAEASGIQSFCLDQLAALKLEIPALVDGSKTRIYGPDEPAEFLGLELAPTTGQGYELRVSSKQMERIKHRIHSYGSIRELRQRNLGLASFGNALESAVRAYEAAYEHCANATDLAAHIASCRQNAISNVMAQLGICVSRLDAERRWFLGL